MEPRIQQILNTAPYKILCLWTNGEIRTIDLENQIHEHLKNRKGVNVYSKLLDKQIFGQVQLNNEIGTLCWQNLTTMIDLDGKATLSDFDICPDVLYEISKPC